MGDAQHGGAGLSLNLDSLAHQPVGADEEQQRGDLSGSALGA